MSTTPHRDAITPSGIVVEVIAALLVPAASVGFIRLFADNSAILPIIGASLMSTAVAVALRRARVPLVIAAVISAAALAALLSSRYAPDTTRFGLVPTRDTIEAFRVLGDAGLVQFREMRAPVDATAPFVAASMIAAWVMAFLTDWGALRLRLAFEPVLPASLIFIFGAVLGDGTEQLRSTIVFAAVVIAWAVAQRTSNLADHGVWLSADRRRGPQGLARSALGFSVVALAIGVVAGPRLPGADAEELYYWRTKGDPVRQVVSPFVGIENRLVDNTSTLLFTVETTDRAYWRLAGLDTYEDGFWKTQGTFRPEDGELPGNRTTAGTTSVVEQTFKIEALSEIWLPAAFAPSNLISSDVEATWNSETGSLTASSANENSDGSTYTVESIVPMFTADELNAASATVPSDIAARYLTLPDDLTSRVESEALAITEGTTTRYEAMMALQNHFREFDYSVRLGPRGDDPIETFLDERVGFCQQFSGTFALMARTLGAPARVAVGFTWGDPVEGEPNTYAVTGRHTHAWPEVWFDGLGWVAFEPTPGRGSPTTPYTGVTPRQDSLTDPGEGVPTSTTTTPTAPSTSFPGLDPNIEDFVPDLGGDVPTGSDSSLDIPWRVVAIVAVIALYVVGMPAILRLRRARRRQRATTASAEVETAWADAADDLAVGFDLERRPSETRSEFAARISDDLRLPEGAVASLAAAVTEARYRADDVSPPTVSAAWSASAEITKRVRERTTVRRRWLNDLDPRRLVGASHRIVVRADDASDVQPDAGSN